MKKPITFVIISAVGGSIAGILLGLIFPEIATRVISGGTLLGVIAGTAIYSYQLKDKNDSEE